LLVGLPSAVGFSILAKPIIMLLYRNLDGALLDETAMLLIIMSIGVLVLTMLQTMTGILQGLGRVFVPVTNLAVGAVVKIVTSLALIRIPDINVKGAAIGTVACYTIAAILDVYFVVKYTKMKIGLLNHIIKPIVCTALMGLTVYLLYPILYNIVGNSLATLGSITLGAVVYAASLIFTKTITKREIDMIRGRKKTA